ncbi:MAG TPA: hypothetical protein PLH94_04780 [Fimbriimonadaceae bacterium]|nr:hypothetical protein [Fimbriimonadaceae bacterium]
MLLNPAPFPCIARVVTTLQVQVERVDEVLLVEWRSKKVDLANRTATFGGGIKATYGPTTLYADSLFVDSANRQGRAEGNVRLIDPDGTLEGSNLSFDWGKRTGSAENVAIEIDRIQILVKRLEIEPGRWTLIDAYGTPSLQKPREVAIRSRRIVLQPGRRGYAEHPTLEMFGRRILQYPARATFSLDRRVSGFRLPAISFRRGNGFGMAWNSSTLLGDQASLSAILGAFPGALPSYGLEFAWSGVEPTKATGLIAPRTDLGERFGESYLDSIAVPSVETEDEYLRNERRTLSAGSYWNQGTRGRIVDPSAISKRWEIAGEIGGPIGRGGGYVQVRGQSLRPGNADPFRERAVLYGSWTTGEFDFTNNLSARLRVDGAGYVGSGDSYTWLRTLTGVSYRPNPTVKVSAGYVQGFESGTPMFAFDPLFSTHAWHLRADFNFGNIQASVLGKYDVNRREWYDKEYGFSFIAGSFEPFVIWRQFPNDVRFGARLRIDALLGRLQKRKQERDTPSK